SLPPNVFRIAAQSSRAVLYLLNRSWCSSGRDSSRVVLAFTSFFFFCMSSVVNVTVLPDFVPVSPLVVSVVVVLGEFAGTVYESLNSITSHRAHVEDIVVFETAIARILLYLGQWYLSSLAVGSCSVSGNSYNWQWECLVHFIPNKSDLSSLVSSTSSNLPRYLFHIGRVGDDDGDGIS
nr:hypothetical protein [Tanacetum cinerariifolium]